MAASYDANGNTLDGAYTEFAEARKGMVRPGMLADLVVLSGDPEKTSLRDLTVAQTICARRTTFAG